MTHGHEVLHMMEGNSYNSRAQLVAAIDARFGSDELFHTCSAEGLTAGELVDLLAGKNKFRTLEDGSFTVNSDRICHHG